MNFNNSFETEIYKNQIHEIIHMYGVNVKFIKTDFRTTNGFHNQDMTSDEGELSSLPDSASVFGDFEDIEPTSCEIDVTVLPQEMDGFEKTSLFFSTFGVDSVQDLKVFMSIDDIDKITFGTKEPKDILANIIRFPSNAEFEIVNVEFRTEGINNRFLYSDTPSVYLLTLKTYQANVVDEINKDEPNILKVEDFATQEFLGIAGDVKMPKIDTNIF